MGSNVRSKRVAIGVVLVAAVAIVSTVVLPAIGAVNDPIPPASGAGVTPTEFDTGGQSDDCQLFAGAGTTLSQYRISTPKTQTYTTQVGSRTVTFTLTMSTGKDKDKFLTFSSTGATVYYVGVKGGTNTAKYDYTAAPLAGDTALHAPRDNQGSLYSISNTTFCFATGASISGTVFADANGDGAKGSTESGVESATVRLYDGANVLVTSTTSGVTGEYSFSNVAVGQTYRICQVPLSGSWTQTLPTSATGGSTACPAEGNRGYGATLTTSRSGLDFGSQQTASVSGRVFEDANANGSVDTGEGGITSQTVTLRRDGTSVATATLDAAGSFTLTGIPVGPGYTLCAVGGSSLRQTAPAAGASCSSESTRGYSFTLGGSGSTGNLFGFVRQAIVSGTIFDDKDVDGVQDAGEGGISGRNVYLYKSGVRVGDPVSTGSGGGFSFGSQDVGGQYKVCVARATGQAQTSPTLDTGGSTSCGAPGETAVGWGFTLTTDGKSNLGFGSVTAITGSCAAPFGSEEGYRIQLAGGPPDPCDKSFVYEYRDTTEAGGGLASLQPVPGSSTTEYAMVERITWTLPSDGQQFDVQYDDIVPYLTTEARPMLYCKLDPRDGTEFGLQSVYYSADFGGDPGLVIPGYPTQTSCIIDEDASTLTGTYVAFVYSSIDGLRLPTG